MQKRPTGTMSAGQPSTKLAGDSALGAGGGTGDGVRRGTGTGRTGISATGGARATIAPPHATWVLVRRTAIARAPFRRAFTDEPPRRPPPAAPGDASP